MLMWLLYCYFSALLGIYAVTVILISLGLSWGPLPKYYLNVVKAVQKLFPTVYPKDVGPYPSIIEKKPGSAILRNAEFNSAFYRFASSSFEPLDLCQGALIAGVEAIVQDDVSHAYTTAPSYRESLLRRAPEAIWNKLQICIFYFTFAFRLFILFPIRFSLFLSSFVVVFGAGIVSIFKTFSDEERTSVSIVYCRLYNAAMGVIAEYHDPEFRPQQPGIAMSNHLSPNDVQILFGDVQHGSSFGYVVTGQKHSGIIGLIQKLADRIARCLWLERKNQDERKNFQEDALMIAKKNGPVLLFPEGYCSNNTLAFQFRKALFQQDVMIYPMAIKQDGAFGDGFWSEDEFYLHVFRLMLSWAVVYDVHYLPRMHRDSEETAAQFAKRCQLAICSKAGIVACAYDGGLWYKKEDRSKLKANLQKSLALRMTELGHVKLKKTDILTTFNFVNQTCAHQNCLQTHKCARCASEVAPIFEPSSREASLVK